MSSLRCGTAFLTCSAYRQGLSNHGDDDRRLPNLKRDGHPQEKGRPLFGRVA